MGLFSKVFSIFTGRDSNERSQEDINFENRIRSDGYKKSGKRIADMLNAKITSEELAKQFVLEELDAARRGNDYAQKFAKDSGFEPVEYIGAIKKTRWEGDESELEHLQLLLRGVLFKISDIDLMVKVSTTAVDEIMKLWALGKYSSEPKQKKIDTWLDEDTDLMWQLDIEDKLFTWDDANNYVQKQNAINYGGYSDWRLPTIEELERVYGYKHLDIMWKYKEKGITTSFDKSFYWSSTLLGERVDKILDINSVSENDMHNKVWDICITNGMAGFDPKSDEQCVRLVRGKMTKTQELDPLPEVRREQDRATYKSAAEIFNTGNTVYFNSETMKLDDHPSDLLDYGIQHCGELGEPATGMTLLDQGKPDKLDLRVAPYIENYGLTVPTLRIKKELADLSGYFSEEIFEAFIDGFARFVSGTRMDKKLTLGFCSFANQNNVYMYNNEQNGDAQYIYSFRQQPAQFEIYIGADDVGSVTELNYFHQLNRTEVRIPLDTQGFWYMFQQIFCDINGISSDDIVLSSGTKKKLTSLLDLDPDTNISDIIDISNEHFPAEQVGKKESNDQEFSEPELNKLMELIKKLNTELGEIEKLNPELDIFGKNSSNAKSTKSHDDIIVIGDFVWEKESHEMNWHDAMAYAKALRLGGYDDWRLPTLEELKDMVRLCGGVPIYWRDYNYDENIGVNSENISYQASYQSKGFTSRNYWSSITYSGDAGAALGLYFGSGDQNTYRKNISNYIRCVRG